MSCNTSNKTGFTGLASMCRTANQEIKTQISPEREITKKLKNKAQISGVTDRCLLETCKFNPLFLSHLD